MIRLLSLLCLLLVATSAAPRAHAQAFGDVNTFAPAKFGDNNAHLKTLLQLQYQMQVLKRLIEREKSVNAMVTSAVAIGVADPMIPKPDQALCAQVPANIPCATAYKDMYPHFVVDKIIAEVLPPSLPNGGIPAMAANSLEPLPAASLAAPTAAAPLYWADVTCMNEKCSAIITPDPHDPRARYRVSNGEKLLDGATVSSISANGVTIQSGTTSIHLDPAPKA